ncbi:unnamed protein product, partial [Ectocarpus sp. 8 AP-2014]
LEGEEISRITALCSRACSAEGSTGDMPGMMEEVNVDYLRTMNKIVLGTQTKEGTVYIGFEDFQERSREFCFSSFLTKPEIIKIIVQDLRCSVLVFSAYVTATCPNASVLRVTFTCCVQATQTTSLDLKEQWVINIVNFIRHHLKDVKKGWFNLDETSNEVYGFSKLRRFLAYVNFMTQDTLRFLVQASLDEFVRFLLRACLHDARIVSSNKVVLKIPILPDRPSQEEQTKTSSPVPGLPLEQSPVPRGGSSSGSDSSNDGSQREEEGDGGVESGGGVEAEATPPATNFRDEAAAIPQVWSEGRTVWKGDTLRALRAPLFVVEIAVVGDKGSEVFAYSQRLPAVKEAALALIDKAISSTQNMVRVERRVMKKLFWSHDPVMSSVYSSEDWVQHLRETVAVALDRAVKPATEYLETLEPFVEFLNVDVNEYLCETEAAMTKAETGEFLFDDLRQLAANHAQQKIEFEKLIPENISLGLFVVSMSKIRQRLSSKHQDIAERLTLMLTK